MKQGRFITLFYTLCLISCLAISFVTSQQNCVIDPQTSGPVCSTPSASITPMDSGVSGSRSISASLAPSTFTGSARSSFGQSSNTVGSVSPSSIPSQVAISNTSFVNNSTRSSGGEISGSRISGGSQQIGFSASPSASRIVIMLELPPPNLNLSIIPVALIKNLTKKPDVIVIKDSLTFVEDLELEETNLEFNVGNLSKIPTIHSRKSIIIDGEVLIITLSSPLTSPQLITLFILDNPTQKRQNSDQNLTINFEQILIQDKSNSECSPIATEQSSERSFGVLLTPRTCNQGSGNTNQKLAIGLAVGITVGVVSLIVIGIIGIAIVAIVVVNKKNKKSTRGRVNVQ